MEIALALGGGGAKGNAHIGVLRVLEREGFQIRAVAGTSFGGLVGCFYAAGFDADEIEQEFATLDQARLYERGRDESPSFLGLGRVRHWLDRRLAGRTFEEARIPCAVTAVDLRNAQEVVLQSGSMRDAILATIALPGIFPSCSSGELELVDGGLLNPIPVAVARALAPALPVVAVSLSLPLGTPPRSLPLPFLDGLPAPLAERIRGMRVAQASDIFLRSIEIGGRQIADLRLQLEKPEVIIRPAVDEIGVLDRVDVHDVVVLGEQAAEEKLPELRRLASWQTRLRRWAERISK
jgi:NTE family protein